MNQLDALSRAFDHTARVMAAVTPEHLDSPTPCRDWDVRTLAAHTIGVVTNIGRGVDGEELLADVNSIPLESDLGAQFRRQADHTLDAWKRHGLDGEVNIGAGPMPASAGLGINLLDTTTHSWDLARATGQPAELSDDLALAALSAGREIVTDDVRSFAGFDPVVEVAQDASATDQLVAFLGRQP